MQLRSLISILLVCIAAGVPVQRVHLSPSDEGTDAGIYQWQLLNLPSSFSVPGGVRHAAVAHYDGKVFFYGGQSDETFSPSNELNVFDTLRQRWTSPQTTGDVPPALSGASFVPVYNELWLVGGVIEELNHVYNSDIYALDSETWTWVKLPSFGNAQRNVNFFPGFKGSCAVFDDANETLYVLGGFNANEDNEYLSAYQYEFSSTIWTKLNASEYDGVAGAACEEVNGVVYLFGGITEDDIPVDTIMTFDVETATFEDNTPTVAPTARAFGRTLKLTGSRILYGFGSDNATHYNDLYVLDTKTNKVVQVFAVGAQPSVRADFVPAVGEDGAFYFLGGNNETDTFTDVWMMYEVCDLDNVTLAKGCQACPKGLYANYGDVVCSKCTSGITNPNCASSSSSKKHHHAKSKAWIAGVVIACVVVCVVIIIAIVILIRKKKQDKGQGKQPGNAERGEAKPEASASSSSSGSESEELATSSSEEKADAKGKSASKSATSESESKSKSDSASESSESSEESSSESRSSD